LALHTIFTSIKKVWSQFDGTHTVFCLEGRSWRKDLYTPYKANRKVTADARSAKEVEEDKIFFEVMDNFIEFLRKSTNCSVLKHPNAEADDMIARWIALHPDDLHVVISSDSDFQQLIKPNVMIFNGIAGLLIKASTTRTVTSLLTRRARSWASQIQNGSCSRSVYEAIRAIT
jgi:5'-3' exonuclease